MTADFSDGRFWALLDRYIAGDCSGAEAKQIQDWLAADPANWTTLEEVERFRGVARNRAPVRSAQAAWQQAVEALRLEPQRGRVIPPTIPLSQSPTDSSSRPHATPVRGIRLFERSRMRRRIPVAIAAGIGIAFLGNAVLQAVWRAPTNTSPTGEAREYTTARGQRANVELADGSRLTIGPASTVRLGADFGEKSRDVTLVGEAHFRVGHDVTRPFRVHTSTGIAEDLGTEFVVNAYPEMHATEVVVASGKVALSSLSAPRGSGTALSRGQLGRIDTSGFVTVASGVDLDMYVGWTDGRISFRDMPLRDALPRLSRWYDIELRLSDDRLAALPLSASFKDEPLTQVLQILDITLGVRHEQRGRTVTFYPRGGVPVVPPTPRSERRS